jgi:hypothetical protein
MRVSEIKKILREPLLYLLPLLALAGFWLIPSNPGISDIILITNENTDSESLPLSTHKIKENSNFSISFNLNVKNSKEAVYKFYPDDCILGIKVNGKNFPEERIKNACDYHNGTILNFSEFAESGTNRIEFQMKNNGGPGGMRIDYIYNGFSSLGFKQILFSVLLLIATALILKKFKFGMFATLLVLLGICVRLIYFSYTGPTERVYDMDYGHLVYINMIIKNEQIPKTDECWSCNHPPLYYLIGAGIKGFFDNVNPFYSLRFLQQISMLFSFVSLAFGISLLYRLFHGGRFALLSGLLFAIWPGFVITAPRIGNDVPFYFGALMCMLFTQMWWNRHKNIHLLLAFLGAAIAVMFKSTGFVILGVLLLVYICGHFRFWKLPRLKIIAGIFIIVVLSALASQHRLISDFFRNETPTLVSVRNLNSGLNVKTSFGSFLYFDMKDYLMEPYTSTWDDRGGRQYFWNFFVKSTLFGEYDVWNADAGKILASILNVLNLLFFLLILWGIINMKMQNLPSLLFFLALLSSLIFTRAYYSVSCLQDFRYIVPILAPMLLFAINGANILRDSRLRLGTYFCMMLFSVLSFLFIVLKGFYI